LYISKLVRCFGANRIRLGIIGGGQLGKMLALEAKRMSIQISILDPDVHCPAASVADRVMVSDFKDEKAIHELAKVSDILTYEIELANSKVLQELEFQKYPVHPAPRTLSIIQDKLKQKQFLKANGIPIADFETAKSEVQVRQACTIFGYPALLKACEDSYDGRGNFLIHGEDEIQEGLKHFSNRRCIIEKFVPFDKEISVMVARNTLGQVESFPVVENLHAQNILVTTIAPARLPNNTLKEATRLAERAIETLDGAGIFGVEMFVKENGDLLINEIAPRPHNSGHYSIEACSVSQFEQHIRAILGLPLAQPKLLCSAVMINILGPDTFSGPYSLCGIPEAFTIQGLKLHLYGKEITKPRRKLGHVTITAETVEDALVRADLARKALIVQELKIDNKFD
jgi:5-(carboxyamino)imidazole ribonucleotide synthase